jgi:hypothetical protein
LAAYLRATPDGALALEVTDAGARYPLTIDPLASTTAATQLNGTDQFDEFGTSVAGVGDVDGDGYADVMVGAPYADPSGRTDAGSAYLYRGSAAGLTTTTAIRLNGAAGNDRFGQSVAGAGDVDGDGYADVLVGAYMADPNGRANAGSAYLYRGSATGLSTTATTRLDGAAANDFFGVSVAGAGDVDGNGYADVLVGAYRINPTGPTGIQIGSAYLFLSSSTGLNTTAAVQLNGTMVGDQFGISVAGVGDVDGDGYADVMVGAPYADPSGHTDAGSAYLYRGSAAGLSTTTSAQLDGAAAGDLFGRSVAGAGDVDGDGYADVLVGAYMADPGGRANAGSAYLYRGSAAGLATTATTRLDGAAANDFFGLSVAGVGDIEGDGYADVLIGATNADPSGRTDAGSAYLYRGSAAGLSTTTSAQLDGAAAGDNFGLNVAGAGDVDGDGYADMLVGALHADPGGILNAGSAYLYRGGTDALLATPSAVQNDPNTTVTQDFFGYSIAGAGDVNGDGYADVIVGAFNASTVDNAAANGQGRAYLYLGSATGLSTTAGNRQTLNDPNTTATADNFGASVAGAGDVNGDGYADVIVGAYNASNTDNAAANGQGRAYLYLGSASGLTNTVGTTAGTRQMLNDPNTRVATDYFGRGVAGAGDVNGDGYADVIIGAYGASTVDNATATGQGRAYLYLGSATGLANTAGSTAGTRQTLKDPNTTATGDHFGYSVSGAGDVNGDGYADVIVGAKQASTVDNATANFQGRAYLYLGSTMGLSSTAGSTAGMRQTLNDPNTTATADQFGWSVSGAGDVNGDGYADVIIGAYNASNTDNAAASSQGRAYLYLGSTMGLSSTAGSTAGTRQTLNNPNTTATFDNFGYSVSGAGDVNGDGYADVIIGAYRASNTDNAAASSQGRAYLYLGSGTSLSSTAGSTAGTRQTLNDPNMRVATDYFGQSVAGPGDVNGDGYSDVLVGAPRAATTDNAADNGQGRSYLYLGIQGAARPGRLGLYNTDLITAISAANQPLSQFGLGLVARSPYGRVRVRLVWETRANGQPFSSSPPITNSTQFTARGPWTDLSSGTVTELKSLISKTGRATKVRARIEYASANLASGSTAQGTGGVGGMVRYGPWQYVSAQQLGQSSSSATPLPVELVSFTAAPEGEAAVRLAWLTASEKNSAAFEVQRSTDGKAFTTISTVEAAGSSSARRSYSLRDEKLPADAVVLYYRLRQLDQDGTASLSPVRVVSVRQVSLNIYPNPTTGAATLTGAQPSASVQVFDVLGRPVLTTTADAMGAARLTLSSALPAGVYLVRAGQLITRLVRK